VEIRPRFNVAPGDDVLAVTTDRDGRPRGELLRWGLVPSWATGPETGLKMINARIETAAQRPAFRSALRRFRCLIIADGFYEWQPVAAGAKRPFHIARNGQQPFAFAGLWSIWHGSDGTPLRTCTILTTAANRAIAPLHNRMPVILRSESEAAWLDPATPPTRLRELAAGLDAAEIALRPVGTAVNNARYDRPDCLLAPIPDAQGTLF
jgi:putative SOS response-associated peptidase YedK